ncbi:NUDIX hydrolase [Companilactobacillus ginsenosidimutans]|uniref:ADP-ribose pyrophosphatase n=1 Tax=Companilactobacillus ginsenosidimutans TaxID=1007676 RepID=A0A0H4R1E3_9LACO|nr:NUDIX hydrolase N-terminal domain-containing protein [Companilactobacillus ginsenosidimutans]AKP67540.1 ADP-ribose pyrophosphatase [Companilactobacillus ginsenosidimutans]
MDNLKLLIMQLEAISQSGLHYTKDVFDKERYEQLKDISKKLTLQLTNGNEKQIDVFFDSDNGYVTPKVDVRAITFNQKSELLMVHEKMSDTWSIPGGWADIGYSASEIAIKEIREEANIHVTPKRLIAVRDIQKHAYEQKNLSYIYKHFIECVPDNDHLDAVDNSETSDAKYFSLEDALKLKLSLNRNLPEDIEMAFNSHENSNWQTIFD